jgi:hypothetical protein
VIGPDCPLQLQYLPELRRRFRLRARFVEAAAWKLSMAAAKMDQRRGGPGEDLGSDQITWVSVHVRRWALNHSWGDGAKRKKPCYLEFFIRNVPENRIWIKVFIYINCFESGMFTNILMRYSPSS